MSALKESSGDAKLARVAKKSKEKDVVEATSEQTGISLRQIFLLAFLLAQSKREEEGERTAELDGQIAFGRYEVTRTVRGQGRQTTHDASLIPDEVKYFCAHLPKCSNPACPNPEKVARSFRRERNSITFFCSPQCMGLDADALVAKPQHDHSVLRPSPSTIVPARVITPSRPAHEPSPQRDSRALLAEALARNRDEAERLKAKTAPARRRSAPLLPPPQRFNEPNVGDTARNGTSSSENGHGHNEAVQAALEEDKLFQDLLKAGAFDEEEDINALVRGDFEE